MNRLAGLFVLALVALGAMFFYPPTAAEAADVAGRRIIALDGGADPYLMAITPKTDMAITCRSISCMGTGALVFDGGGQIDCGKDTYLAANTRHEFATSWHTKLSVRPQGDAGGLDCQTATIIGNAPNR